MNTRTHAYLRSIDVWLVLAIAIGAWLRLSRIGDFHNHYYTAAVASMLQSPTNFLFAAFDPGGVIMVDKPPAFLWIQALPAAILGVSGQSVTLPQAIGGTLAIVVLYLAIRPAFGRVAAASASLTLAVVPISVVIDSGNEPDSLLSSALVLAAFSVIQAQQTGRLRWLLTFALLMGLGFNLKMLAAFIPLPAFLLYYLLATQAPLRRVAMRAALAFAVLAVASLSWVTVVALTPPEHRPYVGSTRDNSIWTLVVEYNGIERFTSFIGRRPRQGAAPSGGAAAAPLRQLQAPPGAPPPQFGAPLTSSQPAPPDATSPGLLGLFANPLAAQLGWLLPLGLLSLAATLVPLLSDEVFKRPRALFAMLRESPAASQSILWGGWFAAAVLVFGLARATTTHPYYLAGVTAPMAAVMGIGLSVTWRAFQQRRPTSWALAGAIGGGAAYQVIGAETLVADWAIAITLAGAALAILVMVVAIWRRLTPEPLATASVAAGALSVLLVPLVLGMSAGGRIEGPGAALPRPAQAVGFDREQERVDAISAFIRREGDAGSVFVIGAVNAREAAPFIIAGVPALAIGGFSGSDPVYTAESFQAMAERGELRYFLLPGPRGPGSPTGPRTQERILTQVRRTWEDVSREAGLPPASLYRYRVDRR